MVDVEVLLLLEEDEVPAVLLDEELDALLLDEEPVFEAVPDDADEVDVDPLIGPMLFEDVRVVEVVAADDDEVLALIGPMLLEEVKEVDVLAPIGPILLDEVEIPGPEPVVL